MTGSRAALTTKIIRRDDVAAIVDDVGLDPLMEQMIASLTEAVALFDAESTKVLPRDGFNYTSPDVGLLEWMPIMHTAQSTTIKVVGYHPSNPERRSLPTILSTISVFDAATGHLDALADATFLTAVRTGAASAVASRFLARPASRVLGMIGCGAQSITQVHAMVRTFPIDQVLIADSNRHAEESFVHRIGGLLPEGIEVRRAPIDRIVESADIVCTATSVDIGAGPLFGDIQTKPWLHVNAVGSDFPGKIELPLSLLRKSVVCPDVLEQATKEGECQQLSYDDIGPTLAQLAADPDAHRSLPEARTVFDSTGWAVEDHVAMHILLRHAERLGLGLEVHLEDIGDDPLDPYQLARQPNSLHPTAEVLERAEGHLLGL